MTRQLRSAHRPRATSGSRAAVVGTTMVEVLIALLVLAVGLLGLAVLTLNSVRFSDDSGVRSNVISYAYDMADRIRANDTGRDSYVTAYADSVTTTSTCNTTACIAGDLATWDIAQWKQALSAAIPSGAGQISQNAVTRQITIAVQWSEKAVTRSYSLLVSY